MRVLVWVVEGTWKAAVAAAREFAPGDADITLLHVVPAEAQAVARDARHALLGRNATLDARRGRVEQEVVAAGQKMDLLVLARDCDPRREGPRSLGPTARFVIDHASCPVLLVWPDKVDVT